LHDFTAVIRRALRVRHERNRQFMRWGANDCNREDPAVRLGLISATIFGLCVQPLNASEIFLA